MPTETKTIHWPKSRCQTHLICYLDKINLKKDLRLCWHPHWFYQVRSSLLSTSCTFLRFLTFFSIFPLPICLWSQRKGYQTTRMPSHHLDLPKQKQSLASCFQTIFTFKEKKAEMVHLQSCNGTFTKLHVENRPPRIQVSIVGSNKVQIKPAFTLTIGHIHHWAHSPINAW